MKLYTSHGPNPQVVETFLARKGVTLPRQWVDIGAAENRQAAYSSSVNPAGTTPALQLDDGTHISEIIAICEYLEERFPEPVLIGRTAEERAVTRMWTRRVDLMVCEPLANAFRYGEGLAMFSPRMRCLPEAAGGLKALAQDGLRWLDARLDGPWIAGQSLSLADILLFVFLRFGQTIANQPLDPGLHRLNEWYTRASNELSPQNA